MPTPVYIPMLRSLFNSNHRKGWEARVPLAPQSVIFPPTVTVLLSELVRNAKSGMWSGILYLSSNFWKWSMGCYREIYLRNIGLGRCMQIYKKILYSELTTLSIIHWYLVFLSCWLVFHRLPLIKMFHGTHFSKYWYNSVFQWRTFGILGVAQCYWQLLLRACSKQLGKFCIPEPCTQRAALSGDFGHWTYLHKLPNTLRRVVLPQVMSYLIAGL